MKFKVRTYFQDSQDRKKMRGNRVLTYTFNIMYRTIIPLFLFYALLNWEVNVVMKVVMGFMLAFFAFYQFTWEVE